MRQPATAQAQGLAGRAGLGGQGGVPQDHFELGMASVGEHEAQHDLFGVGGHDVQRLARLAPLDAGHDVAVHWRSDRAGAEAFKIAVGAIPMLVLSLVAWLHQ